MRPSHAVYVAQTGHEHLVYSSGTLSPEDNIVRMVSPDVSCECAIYSIEIDDFFLFCLDQRLATEQFDRVLAAYRRAGFVVKASKVVRPTTEPVKVIGFEVRGPLSSVRLPTESRVSLARATLAVLCKSQLTGTHPLSPWSLGLVHARPPPCVVRTAARVSFHGDCGKTSF
jgi:hypothetical protein